MLRGHVFKSQTFANEIFAIFIDTFLDGNMGIVKGCELSNTNNSVTIGEGCFCVKGRFLEILGNETINISDNGYYSLICEIDLSKVNTKEDFLQGTIKVISGATTYPTLTQQDLNNGGTLYQYEFAKFRKNDAGITDFVDKRTFLNLTSIYSKIESDATAIINQIQESLDDVLDGSIYVLKTEAENTYVSKTEIGTIASKNYSYGTAAPSGRSQWRYVRSIFLVGGRQWQLYLL